MEIDKTIFRYVWYGKYQPIKRTTLCKAKKSGGIGILNVYYKSLAILCVTFRKEVMQKNSVNVLGHYFCKLRVSYLIHMPEYDDLAFISPHFYSCAIDVLRRICNIEGFLMMNSKHVYDVLIPNIAPKVEEAYPLFNWQVIWTNLHVKFIAPKQRELLYRYIHETLPTNDRLLMLGIKDNNRCDQCTEIENNMHIFYFCKQKVVLVNWITDTIKALCGPNIRVNLMRFLMFHIDIKCKKIKNTIIMLLSDYIFCVWIGRQEGYSVDRILKFLRGRIKYNIWGLRLMLCDDMENWFTANYIKYV